MNLLLRLLIVTVLTDINYCFSQSNFSDYKLVVLIEVPNKKIEEKLDPNDLSSYHEEIKMYNSMLKKSIENNWRIGSKIEFVNKEQFNKIIDSKSAHTFVLFNTKYNFNYSDYSSYKLSNKLYDSKAAIVENYSKKQLPYRACSMELKKADLSPELPGIATAIMPSIKQDEAQLVYAIKSLALQIEYKNKGTSEVQLMKMYIKNAPHLKDLTLLINQSDIDESIKSEINTHYKFEHQLVPKETIDKAILSGDHSKAVVLVIPVKDGSFAFKVFDASNMELLGQSNTLPPSEYYPELHDKIKANHLEEFTHYCN